MTDCQEYQDHRDYLETRDLMAIVVHLDNLEWLERLVIQDCQDVMDKS
jgi:hypothetical protein